MSDWHRTAAARALGVPYPIIQGPFGGGQSSSVLTAAVSNLGGLGSYGARSLNPKEIREVVADIRRRTSSPFAVNLWLSTEDPGASEITREQCRMPAPFDCHDRRRDERRGGDRARGGRRGCRRRLRIRSRWAPSIIPQVRGFQLDRPLNSTWRASWPSRNAFCHVPPTSGCRRHSSSGSGSNNSSFPRESRSTAPLLLEPAHPLSATCGKSDSEMKGWWT